MPPRGLSAASAVGQFTTSPSASCAAQPAGTGITAAAGSTAYSAKAPQPMPTPMTRAPGSRPVTASPVAASSPAASKPARYGGCGPAPNVPWACEMSPKLTPAAVTRIRTSPGPGTGTGTPVIRRRSCGPFRDVCCRARMVAGMLMAIGFLSLAYAIEAGRPTARKTRRERERNRSERLCQVRPEPEHSDQSWVAEGGDPADARAGDGEHADSVRLVVPAGVT